MSSDCITRITTVRSDQFFVRKSFAQRRGCRMSCPISFSGRVTREPSPVSRVIMNLLVPPALPNTTDSMWVSGSG